MQQHLPSVLTTRQREILAIAVHNGYYKISQLMTYENITHKTRVSTATVSEHLRKIEQRVFSTLVE